MTTTMTETPDSASEAEGDAAVAAAATAEHSTDLVAPTSSARAPRLRRFVSGTRRWLRAFRRTRPFWGCLWLGLGGFWVIHFSLGGLQIAMSSGFSGMSGWVVGGGMMLCALIGLLAPSQRLTVGIIGLVLSIVSLVASNLGGFFLGMSLGIIGATMMLVWGPKRVRRGRRAAAAAPSD